LSHNIYWSFIIGQIKSTTRPKLKCFLASKHHMPPPLSHPTTPKHWGVEGEMLVPKNNTENSVFMRPVIKLPSQYI
jgi:hypothetical protein